MDTFVHLSLRRSLYKYIYTHTFLAQIVNRIAYGVLERALVDIAQRSCRLKTLESIELHTTPNVETILFLLFARYRLTASGRNLNNFVART